MVASPGPAEFAETMTLFLQFYGTTYRDVMLTSIMIQGLLARLAGGAIPKVTLNP